MLSDMWQQVIVKNDGYTTECNCTFFKNKNKMTIQSNISGASQRKKAF